MDDAFQAPNCALGDWHVEGTAACLLHQLFVALHVAPSKHSTQGWLLELVVATNSVWSCPWRRDTSYASSVEALCIQSSSATIQQGSSWTGVM
jgi:hypothetical protein